MNAHASRLLAWLCGTMAVVSGLLYLLFPWRESFDADIVGVLWVLMNVPKLAAAGMFFLALTGVLLYTLRSLRDA